VRACNARRPLYLDPNMVNASKPACILAHNEEKKIAKLVFLAQWFVDEVVV
jgi:hypothetical protein